MAAKHKVNSLEQWLEIATEKIAEAGKKRIRLEIESHYADAVATHIEEGEPEAAAIKMALAELGNPRAARKHFRKRHLLESETDRLKWALNIKQRIFLLLMGYFFCARFVGSSNIATIFGALTSSSVFIVLVILPTLLLALARGQNANKWARTILVLDPFIFFSLGLFFNSFDQPIFSRLDQVLSGIILFATILLIWKNFRLAQKVRRDWPEWPKPVAN